MLYIAITLGLSNVCLIALVYILSTNARNERQDLENRLMVLLRPEAAVVHKTLQDPEPPRVSYMDEQGEFEYEQKNGHHDLLGDD